MGRVGAILRLTVRTLGELLVTFSVLLGLFIVYQLYYTNVVGRQEMGDEVAAMRKQWAAAAPAPVTSSPVSSPTVATESQPVAVPVQAPLVAPTYGGAVAILYIPHMSGGTGIPVLEGVELDILNKATGHYPGSALPGQLGNFAVAGHRKTHGEPFRHLDVLRAGDYVYVETAQDWYTYRLDDDPVIIDPRDVGVVDPVPGEPGAAPTRRLITLTTCNPWWASTQRMVVTGHLVDTRAAALGPPPGVY
jgi:sortase A